MSWARILAPLGGAEHDAGLLAAAAEVAAPFDAEVAAVFAPPDMADFVPWMSDGMVGGVEIAAIDAVRHAASEGLERSHKTFEACAAPRKSFIALKSPVQPALGLEARLSDLVVFDQDAVSGRSRLGQAFQELLAAEQRPILVTRGPLAPLEAAIVAWNGSKEASRAVRTALPLLRKAGRVVVVTIDEARTRDIAPERLVDFLAARGVAAEGRRLAHHNDPARSILDQAREERASLIVSGAFGHARLREYVLGGATRSLLNADGPSLFLSH